MKSIKIGVSNCIISLYTGENDWEGQDNGEETSDQCSGGGLPSAETTGFLKTVSGCTIMEMYLTRSSLLLYSRFLIKHEK